ncbi:hypothetical protein H6P81_015362 [Aristolochia fimbriata]|uniref:SGTA homodimerisation domain-containing protein n=1 Tax=Aristolochia fimbriata TaxID=158543 RepID=A0AAV7E5E5_ARIFI|nr:hypothetical protein H6P81_015362 [Aristolochia fimbriata]
MANLRTDSPLSRRIASAFLDFLKSVEPASGVDSESIEVISECVEEVFKFKSSSIDDRTPPGLLVDLFSSIAANGQHGFKSAYGESSAAPMAAAQNTSNGNTSETLRSMSEELSGDNHIGGVANDELFGQFCGALERIHFFKATPAGDDDHVQLAKAKRIFDDALVVAIKSGISITDAKSIAETLKLQGNQAMHSKSYTDAVDIYTCAIALCQNNAIYYCNRAAAYTQIHEYSEAIEDCKKSIEIDPRYSKAYSRLGMAYYAQGNYSDAINLGYLKALELDPNNSSIRENIRVAEQKLREEFLRMGNDQGTEARLGQDPENQSPGSRHRNGGASSFTFGTNLPAGFANMFMNMASNGQSNRERSDNAAPEGSLNEPEIRVGGNISLNVGENVPEEVSGALRSVMEMFSSSQGPQGNAHRG